MFYVAILCDVTPNLIDDFTVYKNYPTLKKKCLLGVQGGEKVTLH